MYGYLEGQKRIGKIVGIWQSTLEGMGIVEEILEVMDSNLKSMILDEIINKIKL